MIEETWFFLKIIIRQYLIIKHNYNTLKIMNTLCSEKVIVFWQNVRISKMFLKTFSCTHYNLPYFSNENEREELRLIWLVIKVQYITIKSWKLTFDNTYNEIEPSHLVGHTYSFLNVIRQKLFSHFERANLKFRLPPGKWEKPRGKVKRWPILRSVTFFVVEYLTLWRELFP